MKLFKLILLTAITLISLNVLAEDVIPKIQLLKERRSTLKFPTYTTEQKKIVLNQVRMVLTEIFVHRELKIKDFGPTADPVPALNEIEKSIETVSDYNFHKQMAEIFFNLRDFHTDYFMPRPYACYRSVIPLSFKEVTDLAGNKVIAVSAITEKSELLKYMPENFQIEVGDVVLQYNGQPIRQAMRNVAPRSRGANAAAVIRHTAHMLTYVSQNNDVAPAADEVVLILKNRQGKTYKNTIPWISTANADCLKSLEAAPVEIAHGKANLSANEYQNEFNKIFRKSRNQKSSTDGDGLKDTLEPILKYKKLNNEYGTFGYFQLESFVPEKLSIDGVVLEFKKLLQTEFLNTTGIIIDLRDNGGGMISLAEKLSQLFTSKDIMPMNFRLRNSPANLHYMQAVVPFGRFTKALIEASQTGAINTRDLSMSGFESINNVGQYFFRPVVILTNSSCYSSCDMLSAQMQDHEAAVIFGEDANTGAGGANNYNLRSIYNELTEDNKGPFKLLPNNQNIGFSFRQTVRVGLHKDEVLENVGVIADKLVMPSISDLYNFSENQFKVLTAYLNKSAVNFPSWISLSNDGSLEIARGEKPDVFAKWARTDTLEYRIAGKIIETLAIEENNTVGRKLIAPELISTSEYKRGSYEIIGYYKNKKVWRKIVSFRVVPKEVTVLASTGLNFDLTSGLPSYLYIYNESNKAEDGWLAINGALKISDKDAYVDEVHSQAVMFLSMPTNPLILNFEAIIATELNFDFFKVVVFCEGKETIILPAISGEVALKSYTFDLSTFAGKKIEMKFVFDSDEGGNGPGVIVKNISLH